MPSGLLYAKKNVSTQCEIEVHMRSQIRAQAFAASIGEKHTFELPWWHLGTPQFFEFFERAIHGLRYEEVAPDDSEECDGAIDETNTRAEAGMSIVEEVWQRKRNEKLLSRVS